MKIVDQFQLQIKSINGYWNLVKHGNAYKTNETDKLKVYKIPL